MSHSCSRFFASISRFSCILTTSFSAISCRFDAVSWIIAASWEATLKPSLAAALVAEAAWRIPSFASLAPFFIAATTAGSVTIFTISSVYCKMWYSTWWPTVSILSSMRPSIPLKIVSMCFPPNSTAWNLASIKFGCFLRSSFDSLSLSFSTFTNTLSKSCISLRTMPTSCSIARPSSMRASAWSIASSAWSSKASPATVVTSTIAISDAFLRFVASSWIFLTPSCTWWTCWIAWSWSPLTSAPISSLRRLASSPNALVCSMASCLSFWASTSISSFKSLAWSPNNAACSLAIISISFAFSAASFCSILACCFISSDWHQGQDWS